MINLIQEIPTSGKVSLVMNRLKELRTDFGLTQQKTADIAEVSKRTYIYWENGETQIKPSKAQVLADYFGVNVGYLLGYTSLKISEEVLEREVLKSLPKGTELDPNLYTKYLEIIESLAFLNLDLETMVSLYHYMSEIDFELVYVYEVIEFFDQERDAYLQTLSIVDPWDADGILNKINTIGDYVEKLQEYEVKSIGEVKIEDIGLYRNEEKGFRVFDPVVPVDLDEMLAKAQEAQKLLSDILPMIVDLQNNQSAKNPRVINRKKETD